MSGRWGGRVGVRWLVLGLAFVMAVTAVGAGTVWYRERSRRIELAEARDAMAAGRFGLAHQRLARLAGRWPDDGEILLLLGEAERERGIRDAEIAPELGRDAAEALRRGWEAALSAWARVPASSPYHPRAALLRATRLINTGRYAPAEDALESALRQGQATPEDRYELERALSRLYRFEGRLDDVRRMLRTSWCRSPDPSGVLRELWLLDYSPMPVEALQRALANADDRDDRVWLGRGNQAILTGRFAEASGWLDRALKTRPEDEAVWQAKRALAQATDDIPGLLEAAKHLPAGAFEPRAFHALRVWLADRLGQREVERRELLELIAARARGCPRLERLAVLTFQAGQARRGRGDPSSQGRGGQGPGSRPEDPPRSGHPRHAEELSELCRALGREFDALGWALVQEARALSPESIPASGPRPGNRQPALTGELLARAIELASPPKKGDYTRQLSDGLLDLSEPTWDSPRAAASKPVEEKAGRPSPRFVDDAQAAGLRFIFDNGQTSRHLLPETMSGGVALLDFDGDGWLDVYCVQGGDLFAGTASEATASHVPGDRLFRNRRDGTFEDVTESSRIAAVAWGRGYGMGVAVGDYDNDGDPDLFVTRIATYALYRNRGDGTFEDVTAPSGLAGARDNPTSAAFVDLDNDGDLDLYVCHYMLWDPKNPVTLPERPRRVLLLRPQQGRAGSRPCLPQRQGAGSWTSPRPRGCSRTAGHGLGVVAADLDDDDRIDLYVANDGTANYLYRNQGGFRFEDVALEAGVAGNASGGYQAGMGVACGDLDGDGRPDLMVTNFYGEGTTYYQNLGQGLFADRSSSSGLGLATRYLLGFGIAMADVTNYGRRDVMIANGHVNDNRPYFPYMMPCRLYENRPDGRLVDISAQSGPPWEPARLGRGLAAGDLDNDGRPDAVILAQNEPVAYFHNQSEGVGHFVTLRLEGTASNRDGVGARVTVVAGASPAGRPASRRRQLPVGQRPAPPFRPRHQRSGRVHRGALAVGEG